jgi:hypothetical protein
MIKKQGSQHVLYSKDGSKKLSKPGSLDKIKKREKQVQFFKKVKKAYSETKDLEEHEKGAKKRFKKIHNATKDIQSTLKELTAADEALTKAFDERRTIDNKDTGGERVGLQDVSASKKTLEVDTEKGERADRVEIDAYKAFLNKGGEGSGVQGHTTPDKEHFKPGKDDYKETRAYKLAKKRADDFLALREKEHIKKATDGPSYTVEMRDGVADYDRHLMEEKKKKLGLLKENKHIVKSVINRFNNLNTI